MKKVNYLIVILLAFFTITLNCNASTHTYTRSTENLLVPKDVIVDSTNINAIMNTPAVASNEKIYDFANLLDDNRESELTSKILEFSKTSNMDIVIVTTSDLRGFQIPEYTYNFYDYNDFKSDGVILVIYAPGGKNPEIFMGNSGVKDSYIFTVYNEGRVNQILAYIYNGYIKDKAYFDACDKYIDIIKGYYATDMRDDEINNNGSIRWVEIIILSVAIAVIANLLFMFKLNKYKVTSKKGEVMDKKVNTSTMIIQQVQDSPFTGNVN